MASCLDTKLGGCSLSASLQQGWQERRKDHSACATMNVRLVAAYFGNPQRSADARSDSWRQRSIQGVAFSRIAELKCASTRQKAPSSGGTLKVEARRSGKSFMFDIADNFVLLEPDQEEEFVTQADLKEKLRPYLENWPGKSLPDDLASFDSIDEALDYLIGTACELQLGAGQGTVQWFEVRLEQ